MAHSHRIGSGPTGLGEESARQFYILFGLVQLNEVNVQRMAADLVSYDIESDYSFVDLLLQPFLLILTCTSRTVTVRNESETGSRRRAPMNELSFTKMEGAGNDYVYIDASGSTSTWIGGRS